MLANVLVIEDNPEIAAMYEGILGKHYQLHKLNSLQSIKQHIAHSQYQAPDLAIVDLKLTDGEFLTLREDPSFQQQIATWKKIYVTGVNDTNIMTNCLEHGAVDYLTKPFDENELLVKCQRALMNSIIPSLNHQTHEINFKGKRSLPLTSIECRIYNAFGNEGEISKDELMERIWKEDKENPKVAVHISRLRKKLVTLGWSIEYSKKNKKYTLASYSAPLAKVAN